MINEIQQEREQAAAEDEEQVVLLRRIVVGLDASRYSRAALLTAARLAEWLQSELVGLFIEDVDLLRFSRLPFAHEIVFPAAVPRKMDSGQLERLLRMRAAEIRRELEEEAQKRKIRYDFRVVRGPVHAEVLAAAVDADLMALGCLGHSIARRARLGSTARLVVAQTRSAVLLAKPESDLDQPIAVLFDGSPASQRALQVALHLAQRTGQLGVMLWAEQDEDEQRLRQQVMDAVSGSPVTVTIHRPAAEPDEFLRAVRQQAFSLLILSMTDSVLPPHLLEGLVEDEHQQILAIR